MDRLLNTLKFVHKMSADIIKFVCSSEELVHNMLRFWFYGCFAVVTELTLC